VAPLQEPPPGAGSLERLPGRPLQARTLYRVWRNLLPDGTERTLPWWFASLSSSPEACGRFDLPSPMGTCYMATRPEAALLEALQMHLTNLPVEELQVRRIARIRAPDDAPRAAMLTAESVAGDFGITPAIWAGRERRLTQRWAAAIRRDGWWAVYAGVAHDPRGHLRMVALFDQQGDHPPSHGGHWRYRSSPIADDSALEQALARYGVKVREPGQLPWQRPTPES